MSSNRIMNLHVNFLIIGVDRIIINYQPPQKLITDENIFGDFGDFPIQIPKKERVGANFVASYLGNRCELR